MFGNRGSPTRSSSDSASINAICSCSLPASESNAPEKMRNANAVAIARMAGATSLRSA
jgi:hypothetical protein